MAKGMGMMVKEVCFCINYEIQGISGRAVENYKSQELGFV